ncbi:hypothetical protein M378DRAFT_13854 [Amanita muscaria Koide BX008]|uniref:Uncharacterized protein n=1 Tax=Amanita muscaria (strain Koide BX008) TaxID=946122 RepID=A0A0C2WVW7_AMAMK|nr:hypothetical protein M378DRAFT_13854 [Amanita muscaria Koide BX008]
MTLEIQQTLRINLVGIGFATVGIDDFAVAATYARTKTAVVSDFHHSQSEPPAVKPDPTYSTPLLERLSHLARIMGTGPRAPYAELTGQVIGNIADWPDAIRLALGLRLATNHPDAFDPAPRRPGRVDKEFCFGLSTVQAREKILGIMTRGLGGLRRRSKRGLELDGDDAMVALIGRVVGSSALRTEAALNAVLRLFMDCAIYDLGQVEDINGAVSELRWVSFSLSSFDAGEQVDLIRFTGSVGVDGNLQPLVVSNLDDNIINVVDEAGVAETTAFNGGQVLDHGRRPATATAATTTSVTASRAAGAAKAVRYGSGEDA